MTIRDYELFHVSPRWLFLQLETADGTVGWGEPIVENYRRPVAVAVRELLDTHLLGKDPAPIEDHWQAMYRGGFYRGGPVLMSAIAGIDQALWDIKGKHHGTPVYELLGGKARDRVRMYQGIGRASPDELRRRASEAVNAGCSMLKSGLVPVQQHIASPATVRTAERRLAAIRDEVGDEVDIAVDFHGRVTKSMAPRLATALEPYHPMFIEEPVLPEYNDGLPRLAAHTTVPIATGERMFSRWDFKQVFEEQTVDIVQPDLSHAGGITEVRKIAAMAEAYDVALAPHCPLGPIALAACIQVDVNAPNFLVQEPGPSQPRHEDAEGLAYLENPTVFAYDEGGYVDRPREPGLGIEIDETVVRERAGDTDSLEVTRHEDGSVAEI